MLMLISAYNTTRRSLCGRRRLITLVFLAFFLATFLPMEYTHAASSGTDLRGTWEFSFGCSNGGFYSGTLTIDKKQNTSSYTGKLRIKRDGTPKSAEEDAVISINENDVSIKCNVISSTGGPWSNDDFDLTLERNVMVGNLKSTHPNSTTDTGNPTFRRVSK
ncbi:MAG: hypothetical protein ACLP2U_06800 [Syntrophobacteraceae bacterium]